MKKPASRIREEIARLQDQLKAAETKQAERIGRIALRAGLGEIEIDDTDLLKAFEALAGTFRREHGKAGKSAAIPAGTPAGSGGEA